MAMFKNSRVQAVHDLLYGEEQKDKKQTKKASVKNDVKGFKQASVRFTEDEWNEIKKASKELGVSMAEVIRMAVSGQLKEYKSKAKFINVKQGMEIGRIVRRLYEEINGVHRELRRIGVNYNQEIRLMQIRKDYANTKDAMEKHRLRKEEAEVQKGCKFDVSKGEIEMWISRLEKAFKEVGEKLCLIRE